MHARVLANHQRLLGTDLRASGARRVVGSVLAALVHLVTVLLVVGAAWFWTTPAFAVAKVIATVLLLTVAWEVRPRLGRLPTGDNVLTRASAPSSFAVLDEVARATGSRPPDVVVVSPQFNASVGRAGLRGRHVMTLGLPLWEALDDRQRLAALGHECGHEVNGDLRSTLLVGTAIESLHRWAWLLLPDMRATRRRTSVGAGGAMSSLFFIAEYLVPLVLLPISVTIGLLAVGLERIAARSGQRAEYRADELAAATAGTDAAVSALGQFFGAEHCMQAMFVALRSDRNADVWAAERRFMHSVTPTQRERWRRLASREQHRTDASHPPTLLRQEMLRSRPKVPGNVNVTTELLASMTAELTAHESMMARSLREAAPAL
jgi:Zn-dependent protease with chaperone function